MKAFIFALTLCIIMTAGMLLNIKYLNESIEDIRTDIASVPLPEKGSDDLKIQAVLLTEIQTQWYQKSKYISMTVNHADLMETETQFAAAIGAAEAGTRENYLVALSQLDYALSHLSQMSRITLVNII